MTAPALVVVFACFSADETVPPVRYRVTRSIEIVAQGAGQTFQAGLPVLPDWPELTTTTSSTPRGLEPNRPGFRAAARELRRDPFV